MLEWTKKNLILILGIALPIALVLFFWLSALIHGLLVDAPKYDLLYITNYFPDALRYEVKDGKIQFYGKEGTCSYYTKLYRFSPKTNLVKEISIPIMSSCKNRLPITNLSDIPVVKISIPETDNLILDTSNISPDGYRFEVINKYNTPRITGALFFSSHNESLSIIKHGNRIIIPNYNDYFSSVVQFIGWVRE